jgi:hypothetical protein
MMIGEGQFCDLQHREVGSKVALVSAIFPVEAKSASIADSFLVIFKSTDFPRDKSPSGYELGE